MRLPLVLLLAPAMAVAAAADRRTAALEEGRALTRQFAGPQAAALADRFAPPLLALAGGKAGFALAAPVIKLRFGEEQAVLQERVFLEGDMTSYVRVARYERAPSLTATWAWDGTGRIHAFGLAPTPTPAPSDKLDYRTRAKLRLPFARAAGGGTWQVVWGGRDPIENYHVVAPDQRFALDIVVSRDGRMFRGDGARNEDHFCWNEPLLAPAAGQVVAAVGTLPDNKPGELANAVPPGNHVVIDHGDGEHSLLAHLRQNSLAVRVGDRVTPGQVLGRCGNSGRSSQPHLHYHLQTGAAFGRGVGLPAQFNGYEANGKAVARGEPVRGDLLNPG